MQLRTRTQPVYRPVRQAASLQLDPPDVPLSAAVGAEVDRVASVPCGRVVPTAVGGDALRLGGDAGTGRVDHVDVVVVGHVAAAVGVGNVGDAETVARPGGVELVDVRRVRQVHQLTAFV